MGSAMLKACFLCGVLAALGCGGKIEPTPTPVVALLAAAAPPESSQATFNGCFTGSKGWQGGVCPGNAAALSGSCSADQGGTIIGQGFIDPKYPTTFFCEATLPATGPCIHITTTVTCP